MWTLVDIESRNPVLIQNAIDSPLMKPLEKQEDDLSFGKIKMNTEPSYIKEFEVRYNDLDVNGHANNGNYIVWAFEPLPFDFKTNNKIKTIDMMYKKEAKYGEKVLVEVGFNDDKTTVHIVKNMHGDEICLVQCTWT
jgi:acyl-ACP thioesterase